MSNIRTHFTNMKNISMNFTKEDTTTATVTAYDLTTIKDHYERPDIPARVLIPMDEYNGVNPGIPEMMNAGSSGVGGEMFWNLIDLMLFKEVGSGPVSLFAAGVLPDLVRYMGNYIEVVTNNVQLTTNFILQSVTPISGVFEFPLGSGKNYYGVEVQTNWKELINPGG